MHNMATILCLFLTILLVDDVTSHGYLWDPPSRSSAWRQGFPTPKNYDDNALYCGGFARMMSNGGRCGICGDPYDGPRKNEPGGMYATGIIFRTYKQGETIKASAIITANHCGHMQFKICPNNDPSRSATQECLDQNSLQMADGSGDIYKVPCGKTGKIEVLLKLPDDLVCTQCVVQWKYHAGNSWGVDPITKRGCVGCGAQEEFYGCSDVSIEQSDSVPQVVQTTPKPTQRPTPAPTTASTKQSVAIGNPTPDPGVKLLPGQCKAINLWAGNPTLDQWCNDNCPKGNCPSLACDCNGNPVVIMQPTTPKPTTTTTIKPTTTTSKPTTTTTTKPTTTTTTPSTTTTQSTTTSVTTKAGPYVITRTECKAVNLWAGNEYLDRWCADSCARGTCPQNSCQCQKTQLLVTKPTEETLVPFVGTNAPVTNPPTTGAVVNTVKVCKAISEWTGIDVFDRWCTNECNKGHCPASTCVCTETPVVKITTARVTPQPTTTTTTPTTTTTTTTQAPPTTIRGPAPISTCISNGIVGGQYWDKWCQENCNRGYCARDYCNCL